MRLASLVLAAALVGLACAETTTPSPPGTYDLVMQGPFQVRPFLLVGDSVLVAVRIRDARGRDVQASPIWSVSGGGTASLAAFTGPVSSNEDGLAPTSPHQAWVKGAGPGTVTVVARLGADSATLSIQVEQVTLVRIFQYEGPDPQGALQPGDTLAFQAIAQTSPGNQQALLKVTWSVDQPEIVAIREFESRIRETNCCGPEPYGPGLLAVPLKPGEARITARIGSVAASVLVRVAASASRSFQHELPQRLVSP